MGAGFSFGSTPSAMNYEGNPGGVRYLEEGQPPVIVHPTVEGARQTHQAGTSGGNLYYHGGSSDGSGDTVGVETAPKIYLVFWGLQWNSNDPSDEAGILERRQRQLLAELGYAVLPGRCLWYLFL